MKILFTIMILAILFSAVGCNLMTTTAVLTTSTTTTTTAATVLPDRIIAGRLIDIDTISGNKYTTLYFDGGLSVNVTTTSLMNLSDQFYQFFESNGTFTYDLQQDSQNADLYDLVSATSGVNMDSLKTK
jgi:hypothetical protein